MGAPGKGLLAAVGMAGKPSDDGEEADDDAPESGVGDTDGDEGGLVAMREFSDAKDDAGKLAAFKRLIAICK